MIRQNDPRLPKRYKSACNFMVFLAEAQLLYGRDFTIDEILGIEEYALDACWIDKEFTVIKPEQLFNYSAVCIGSRFRCRNIGYVKNGKAVYWSGKKIPRREIGFSQIKYRNPSLNYKLHFVLGDKNYNVRWDPTENSRSADNNDILAIYIYNLFKI